MTEHLDFSIQVRNTTLQVVYGDITRLDVDALVSSDDVHLSGASGLSQVIRTAAGMRLNYELRKFTLPRPLGSVLVSGAGQLSAKYIFHAMTISFDETPQFESLIPRLIWRVLETAALLNVERLAMPMVNAGLVSVPPEVILRVIVEGACCFLATNPSPVQRILLAVYDDEAEDHTAAEARLMKRLSSIQSDMARWGESARAINERLRLLEPISERMADDSELRQVVSARIATAESTLRDLFNCPQALLEAPLLSGATVRIGGAPTNQVEYRKAKERLDTLLTNLQRDITHLNKLQRIQKDRFELLELAAARKGIDTPVDVQSELEDLKASIATRSRDVERLEMQQSEASTQRTTLMQRWEPNTPEPQTANEPGSDSAASNG